MNDIRNFITTPADTPACGIGRSNVKVDPTELWTMTTKPTIMRAFHINGVDYTILRDAGRHPHLIGLDDNRKLRDGDGVWHTAFGPSIDLVDGDKVAFDSRGDVYTVVVPVGRTPHFARC